MQAAKAGILEIGDVFAVNKADRSGASDTSADLRAMLALGGHLDWDPPIVETVASTGSGIDELWNAITAHRAHLGDAGLEAGRRVRRRDELITALAARIRERARGALDDGEGALLAAAVEAGESDPWSAADRLAGF